MDDTHLFLDAVWRGKPDGRAIEFWRRSDSKSFRHVHVGSAADWYRSNGTTDCYLTVGLASKNGQPSSKHRIRAEDVVGIPGVWADIDVIGGPEHKENAAPTEEEARSLAESILVPTLIVNSGYGIQALWLFTDGVWTFETEEDRTDAKQMVQGFQAALRAEAQIRGYGIDSTHDLARLIRVPGGFNHKGGEPAPVELLDDGGPRYTREQIKEKCIAVSPVAVDAGSLEIVVRPDAQVPRGKLDDLLDIDDDFRLTWNHKPQKKSKNWSLSHYEFSLTNFFVVAGWTDQEICNALVYHRNRHEPGDPRGKNRADRIALTIAKVRRTLKREVAEAEREHAVEELASDEERAPEATLTLFNQVLGGPTIKTLTQYGADPDEARFALEMLDSDEIPMGAIGNVINQGPFRERFAAATQFLPKKLSPQKWDNIIAALVRTANVVIRDDDTRAHKCWEWVNEYIERRYSTDKNLACESNDPFVANDLLHVPAGPLQQYLRRIRGERLDRADLWQYLRAAGFTRDDVDYTTNEGKNTTRSYWIAPAPRGHSRAGG